MQLCGTKNLIKQHSKLYLMSQILSIWTNICGNNCCKWLLNNLYGGSIREKSCIFAVNFIVVKEENRWLEKEKTSTNEKMGDGKQDLSSLISPEKQSMALYTGKHTAKQRRGVQKLWKSEESRKDRSIILTARSSADFYYVVRQPTLNT